MQPDSGPLIKHWWPYKEGDPGQNDDYQKKTKNMTQQMPAGSWVVVERKTYALLVGIESRMEVLQKQTAKNPNNSQTPPKTKQNAKSRTTIWSTPVAKETEDST